MKAFAYFLIALFLALGCMATAEAQQSVAKFTFPPEWEPHDAMWIDWTDMGGHEPS